MGILKQMYQAVVLLTRTQVKMTHFSTDYLGNAAQISLHRNVLSCHRVNNSKRFNSKRPLLL